MVGRVVCILNIKKFSKTGGKNPKIPLNKSFFFIFTSNNASCLCGTKKSSFSHKIGPNKASSCLRIAIKSPER